MSSRRWIVLAGVAAITLIWLTWFHSRGPRWVEQSQASRHLPGDLSLQEVLFVRGSAAVTMRCISGRTDDVRLSVVNVHTLRPRSLAAALGGRTSGVAVNGGFFDTASVPIGLMRVDGVLHHDLSTKPLLTGLVIGGKDRVPRLLSDRHQDTDAPDVRQCGPSLVGPRDGTGNRVAVAERTVVLCSDERFGFLTTTPTTLDDLSDLIVLHGDALGMSGVVRALNLDGGPSTGMIYHDSTKLVGVEPRGPLSDALVLEGRSP